VQHESFCFVATLLTYFCWIEGAWGEAVMVAVSFYSPFEKIVKKMNFAVCDTTLRHYLGGTIVGNTSSIL
jgi:hypothetical protein